MPFLDISSVPKRLNSCQGSDSVLYSIISYSLEQSAEFEHGHLLGEVPNEIDDRRFNS